MLETTNNTGGREGGEGGREERGEGEREEGGQTEVEESKGGRRTNKG